MKRVGEVCELARSVVLAHPVATLAAVGAADVVLKGTELPTVARGAIDESAHTATTILLVGAVQTRPSRAFLTGALLGTALLDVDHVPKYLGIRAFTVDRTRPYPHSASAVLAAIFVAGLTSGECRAGLLGVASGLAGHLVRDLGTGTIPLTWPITSRRARIPHAVYVALLGIAAWIVRARAGFCST